MCIVFLQSPQWSHWVKWQNSQFPAQFSHQIPLLTKLRKEEKVTVFAAAKAPSLVFLHWIKKTLKSTFKRNPQFRLHLDHFCQHCSHQHCRPLSCKPWTLINATLINNTAAIINNPLCGKTVLTSSQNCSKFKTNCLAGTHCGDSLSWGMSRRAQQMWDKYN